MFDYKELHEIKNERTIDFITYYYPSKAFKL